MTTTKQAHTPGPWGELLKPRPLVHIESFHESSLGVHICSLPRSEEGKANAHLIAAAPDLLGACHIARMYLLQQAPGALDDLGVEAREAVIAAIAKAEGR